MKDNVERNSPLGDQGLLLTGRMMHVSRLATIGEMASGIAHELNQPLSAIANYAHASVRMLKAPNADMNDVREALEEIAKQAERAGDIIRRMRNLVRQDETEHASVNANDLMQGLTELLQADARAHDTRLRLDLQAALPEILVEPVQIQHVLMNLVRNSLEALSDTPAGQREIVLGTTLTPDGYVELYVADNGPGVSPSAAARLLEPFFTTKETGTGLGLAISNTIVRAHEGKFGHRPNSPSGACFYVQIPPALGDVA